jgi:hypothetical protein
MYNGTMVGDHLRPGLNESWSPVCQTLWWPVPGLDSMSHGVQSVRLSGGRCQAWTQWVMESSLSDLVVAGARPGLNESWSPVCQTLWWPVPGLDSMSVCRTLWWPVPGLDSMSHRVQSVRPGCGWRQACLCTQIYFFSGRNADFWSCIQHITSDALWLKY